MKKLLIGLVLIGVPVQGFALDLSLCRAPLAHRISLPSEPNQRLLRPTKPPCIDGVGFGPCDEMDIHMYNVDVDIYMRRLKEYVTTAISAADEAAEFAQSAIEYVQCESRALSR